MAKISFLAQGLVSENIELLAKEKKVSKADILRKALELYFLMNKALNVNDKRRIAIIEDNKIIDKYILI